ncbi:hypothetical protein BDP27DRAFT_1365771 [Rhodocollybia butyracea]|uniref:Uncharacterized protein n=1 Tax=Rhodocollybia butyracea TaxID=206335 RepID=A0A9P5PN87_9AGAR|nr:hypothetical protein BDP27DRAFT_1365771 [Rhodocollybia butyracea]
MWREAGELVFVESCTRLGNNTPLQNFALAGFSANPETIPPWSADDLGAGFQITVPKTFTCLSQFSGIEDPRPKCWWCVLGAKDRNGPVLARSSAAIQYRLHSTKLKKFNLQIKSLNWLERTLKNRRDGWGSIRSPNMPKHVSESTPKGLVDAEDERKDWRLTTAKISRLDVGSHQPSQTPYWEAAGDLVLVDRGWFRISPK